MLNCDSFFERIIRDSRKLSLSGLIVLVILLSFRITESYAATSPYPKSQVITGITWDWSSHLRSAPGSDIFPMTWADDDNQYTLWGDGGGFGGTNSDGRVNGIGIARIEGTYTNYIGVNVNGGKTPENPSTLSGDNYAWGLISIDGVLYFMGGATRSELMFSSDHGISWASAGWSLGTGDAGVFSLPTFLNFGKDYQGARDQFVYIYSPAEKVSWNSNTDGVYLARVNKTLIRNRGSYEFYTGTDVNGNPLWANDITLRKLVLSWPGNIHWCIGASYVPGIDRYLLFSNAATFGSGSNLTIFDAPTPWGPWTTVGSYNNWGGQSAKIVGYTFSYYIAPKWIRNGGKDFTLVFSGSGASDSWNTVNGSFILATPADTTPPSTPMAFSGIPVSDTRIDFTWNASSDPESGVDAYKIYRDGKFVKQVTSNTAYDTNLVAGVSYVFEVSAVNALGLESQKSLPLSLQTLEDSTPPVINSASAVNVSEVSILFSEKVLKSSAENITNYVFGSGLSIFSAMLAADLKTLSLTTSPHQDGTTYTLTVNNIKDLATNPNTIAPGTTVRYVYRNQLIVSNIRTTGSSVYELVTDGLQLGAAPYIDRSFSFTDIPLSLTGTTYIKTANNDKGTTGSSFLSFNVNRAVQIYVALDDRIPMPSWLGAFNSTGNFIITSDTPLRLYHKSFAPGGVVLGGNNGAGGSMYSVIILPEGNGNIDTIAPGPPTDLTL